MEPIKGRVLVVNKTTLKLLRFLLVILEYVFIAVSIAVLCFVFVGQLVVVSGNSMEPNLHNNEQLVVEKLSLNYRKFERGDVVVFVHPENDDVFIIKRIVGLPNETLEIINNKVYINDVPLAEKYVFDGEEVNKKDSLFEIQNNHYVLLGDNRTDSTDSRDWGELDEDLIIGRAFLVYYPLTNIRLVH